MRANYQSNFGRRNVRAATAWLCLLTLWLGLTPTTLYAATLDKPNTANRAARLTEEQRILHVLNRFGFGARPGDVERVRQMGLDKYFAQQLEPQRLADPVAEAKVQHLKTLQMSTADLFAQYPNPGALLQMLQRNGELPANLAGAREARKENRATKNAPPDTANNAGNNGTMEAPDAMTSPNGASNAANNPPANPTLPAPNSPEAAELRRRIQAYYIANGLQPPAVINRELLASKVLRAVYSERQLQEVMTDFWTNHFNVFIGKNAVRWLLPAYDRDTLRPNALGNFRELLGATAKSPAMLFYLDNFQSVSPQPPARQQRRMQGNGGLLGGGGLFGNGALMRRRQARQEAMRRDDEMPNTRPQQPQNPAQNGSNQPPQQRMKRGINENYARELMELHTLGVDGGYTQKDVQEVARCFTGWTIVDPRGYRKAAAQEIMGRDVNGDSGKFVFVPRLHDDGEKVVLGQKIPAGGGIADGEKVLDILANHPATAKFIATKLARKFVTDDPTPELINRIAQAFTQSKGDIKTTLRAIYTAPEFNAPVAYRAKIKTPFELAVSSIRALGGETDGGPALQQWLNRMGEPLYGYQAPTGYPDKAENWVNTGGLLERLNFSLALAGNRIGGTHIDLGRVVGNSNATNQTQAVDKLLVVIVGGEVSAGTKQTLLKQLAAPAPNPSENTARVKARADDDDFGLLMGNDAGGNFNNEMTQQRERREQRAMARAARQNPPPSASQEVVKLTGLILGSPEFQRQ